MTREMTREMTCERSPLIHALADGELSQSEAADTRAHLADCPACQAELAEVMQLELAVSEAVQRAKADVTPLRSRRWRSTAVVGAVLMAAGVLLYFVARPRLGPPAPNASVAADAQAVALILPPQRAAESRLSWAGAAGHRPYAIVRSAEAVTANVPLGALSDLDRREDWHGVGALALLNGDHRQAEAFFARAQGSAALLADRAALALAEAQPERALAAVEEALRAAPGHPGATWNRALALRDLGLPQAAAAAFRQVAALSEPGWAAEAAARATELETEALARRALTERVLAAGPLLAAAPRSLSVEDARRLPGMTRVYLYDAVRSASPAQLAALQPLIDAVDGQAGVGVGAAGRGQLAALAARARAVASRAPALAATYGEVVAGKPLTAAQRQAFLARLRAARADDLLIGALIRLSPSGYVVAASELPELVKLTFSSPDPWFKVLGQEQRAHVAMLANRLPEAEAVLLRARQRCQAADVPAYRCLRVGLLLSEVYGRWQRVAEARAEQLHTWKLARAEGEWLTEGKLLGMFTSLAVIADDSAGSQRPMARAYAEELALRQPAACDVAVSARYDLALTAINQLRFAEARQELAALPPCAAAPDPADAVKRLHVRVHLVRDALRTAASSAHAQQDLATLRADLQALRQGAALSAPQRAFLDHSEGRLLIDHSAAAGEALLHKAIAAAKLLGADPAFAADALVTKTRAFSYSVLALAKARTQDGVAALTALAQEQGLPVPTRCALGMAVEDQRRMAVVLGADGRALVHYDEARTSPSDAPHTVLTAPLLAALATCPVVDVLARPPVHGTARLLPEALAWRYLSARRGPLARSSGPAVIVADVEPPVTLGLPRLATWQALTGRTLSGASATPERVLSAVAEAGEVVIHAHGLGSREAGDAAFLALSADASGRYALTAADVRATTLRGGPLVVLAACSASLGAPVFHEPWSLPAAFVFAGARAVIASTAPIPDREAAELFDGVRAAVAAGSPAAVALRDARARWLAAGRGDWVKDLLVFE
jgi:hypothetical protein